MVVEDVGEVDFRGGFRRAAVERGGEVEHHRVGGLHIGGTAAPQHAVFGMSVGDFFANQRIAGLQPLWWEIVDDRHSIEVPGQDHTARLAEVGAGHHCVAVTADGQVLLLVKEGLDLVGEGALVVGHGEVLHDLGEQAVQLLGSGCGAVQFKRHVNSVPRGRRAQHTHYMRFCGRIHFYVPHWGGEREDYARSNQRHARLLRYRHRNRGGICCRTNANRRAVRSDGAQPVLLLRIEPVPDVRDSLQGADFRHLPPLDYRGVLLRRAGRRGVFGAQPYVLPPECPGRHHRCPEFAVPQFQ